MSAPRLCVATPRGGDLYSVEAATAKAGGSRDGEEGKSLFGSELVEGARD